MRISLTVVFVLLFLVLTSFSVVAADISDVEFYVGDNVLTYVQLQHPQTVDMYVYVQADSIDSFYADLSKLNINPQMSFEYSEIHFDCNEEENSGSYECIKRNVYITPYIENVNISFNVDSEEIEYIHHFSIDDTNPQITNIKTNYCDADTGKCFVKSGAVTDIEISFSDSRATFYQNKVFYSIGGELTRRVSNCSSSLCTGSFVSSCSSGERLEIRISTSGGFTSSDDAGNIFEGESTTVFYCDEEGPVISGNIGIIFDTQNGVFNTPKQGDPVTIWALVKEDVSGVSAYGNFSSLVGTNSLIPGNCDAIGEGEFNCTWSLSEILPGNHYLDFEIIDGVGRKSTFTSQSIYVDKVAFASEGPTPKIFHDVTATLGSSKGYNRIMIELAVEQGINYPIFANFKMEKAIGGNVEALYTDIDLTSCIYEQDESEVSATQAFDFVLANPLSDYSDTNRIDLVFKGNGAASSVNNIASEFDLKCNMSVVVKVNNVVYQEPTHLILSIPMQFRNSALGNTTPGKAFADKIIEWEIRTQKRWKWVETLNKVATVAAELCQLDGLMANVGMGGTMMQLAGAALGGTNSVAGSTMSQSGNTLTQLSSSMTLPLGGSTFGTNQYQSEEQKKAQAEKSNEFKSFLSEACEFMRCNIEERMKQYGDDESLAGNYFHAGDDFGKTLKEDIFPDGKEGTLGSNILGDINTEIFEGVSVPNVKESMVAAVMTRCYPAMLYHLNQFRQADCQVVSCLKINAKTGGDLAVCEQLKGQFYCQKFFGEVFELPYIRQAKNVVENTNAFIQLAVPNMIKIAAKNTVCTEFIDPATGAIKAVDTETIKGSKTIKLAACTLPISIAKVMNYYEKNVVSGTNFVYPIEEDACAVAFCDKEDIRECEGVTDSLAQKMFGLSVPPNINNDPKEERIKYDDVIGALKNAKLGEESKKQKDAVKDLEAFNIGLDMDQIKGDTRGYYIDEQIANFEALKKASTDQTYITLDTNGHATVSFIEWSQYGLLYETEKELSGHAYLNQKWDHQITSTFISFLRSYEKLKVYFTLENKKFADLDKDYQENLTIIDNRYNKPIADLKQKISDLDSEISIIEDSLETTKKSYNDNKEEYDEAKAAFEKQCLLDFKFDTNDQTSQLDLSEKYSLIKILIPNINYYLCKKNIEENKIECVVYSSSIITDLSSSVTTEASVVQVASPSLTPEKLFTRNDFFKFLINPEKSAELMILAGNDFNNLEFEEFYDESVSLLPADDEGVKISSDLYSTYFENYRADVDTILQFCKSRFEDLPDTADKYIAEQSEITSQETTAIEASGDVLADEDIDSLDDTKSVKDIVDGYAVNSFSKYEFDIKGKEVRDIRSKYNTIGAASSESNQELIKDSEKKSELSADLNKEKADLKIQTDLKKDELKLLKKEEPKDPRLDSPEDMKNNLTKIVNIVEGDNKGTEIVDIFTDWSEAYKAKVLAGRKFIDSIGRKIKTLEDLQKTPNLDNVTKDSYKESVKKLEKYRIEIGKCPKGNSECTSVKNQKDDSSEKNGDGDSNNVGDEHSEELSVCQDTLGKTGCFGFIGESALTEDVDLKAVLNNNCLQHINTYQKCIDKIYVPPNQEKSDTSEIDGYTIRHGWDIDLEKMDAKYLEERNRQRAKERIDKMGQTTDLIATMLKELGWLDWMSLRHWKPDGTVGKFSGWLDSYFSSDSWKQSICSPGIIKNNPSVANGGAVIQCKDALCKPVFTQASEKTKYNESHYLYALTYYIGSIRYPESYNENLPIIYEIEFRGGTTLSTTLFTEKQELFPGDFHEFQQAFPSENNYDEICFVFDAAFPPREPNAKRIFCRDIVDVDNSTSTAWDTGRPTTSEEYQLPSKNESVKKAFGFNINI